MWLGFVGIDIVCHYALDVIRYSSIGPGQFCINESKEQKLLTWDVEFNNNSCHAGDNERLWISIRYYDISLPNTVYLEHSVYLEH